MPVPPQCHGPGPEHISPSQIAVEMRKKLAAARWLPFELPAEAVRIDGKDHQAVFSSKVLVQRFRRLRASGEMDVSVGEVYGGAARRSLGIEIPKLLGAEYLEDQHGKTSFARGRSKVKSWRRPAWRHDRNRFDSIRANGQSDENAKPQGDMGDMMLRLLSGAAALAMMAGTASAEYTLHILHINDLHSRIEPINRFNSTCSAEDNDAGECFGGVARLATKINELRDELSAAGENVIVVDAGDQFQGSLMFTTYEGMAAAEMMNAVGFDVFTLGNHEFNLGPETLGAFVEALDAPTVAGSLDLAGSAELGGNVRETLMALSDVEDPAFDGYLFEPVGRTG